MTKKNLLLLGASVVMLSSVVLTSCSDEKNDTPVNPEPETPELSSNGVYILNQGQFYNGIEGSLNFIDFKEKEVYTNLFSTANRRSLGDTPQCGVRYGGKIYIGVCYSNTIEVIDAENYTSIKQIKLDESTGTQPRALLSDGGKVYASMFDGKVARIDTLSLSVDAVVKVGPNPETPAILGNKMFVPNSDGMNYAVAYGNTASIIDLQSFTVEDTIEVPLNPERFLVDGTHLYLLSKGDYNSIDGAVYEIDPMIASLQKNACSKEIDLPTGCKKIAPATIACAFPGGIYLIDAPFNKSEIVYSLYDSASGLLTEWNPAEVIYPNMIGVDSTTGNIIVTSYIMDGPYPSYTAPGYAAVYSPSRIFLNKYTIGAGPAAIF